MEILTNYEKFPESKMNYYCLYLLQNNILQSKSIFKNKINWGGGRKDGNGAGDPLWLKIQINKYLRVLTTIVGLDDRFGR